MSGKSVVTVKDVHKSFRVGNQDVPVVRGINCTVQEGDFMVVIGPSGSGKSTLLHMMVGLEKPTKGAISFYDENLYDMSENARADFRKANLGMVYQQANWIKALNVVENVAFPLLLMGERRKDALEVARTKLKMFDMGDWAEYFPAELSAGQQQRVALSRALVTDPQLIVADEPTGNLDFENGQHLVITLAELAEKGHTVLMVTHDLELLGLASRAIRIRDGRIEDEYNRDQLRDMSDEMSRRGIGAINASEKKEKVGESK